MGKARALLFYGIRVEEWEKNDTRTNDAGGEASPEVVFSEQIRNTNKKCEIICLTRNYLEDAVNYYIIAKDSCFEVPTGKDGLCLPKILDARGDWIKELNEIGAKLRIHTEPPSWFLFCEERRSCCS